MEKQPTHATVKKGSYENRKFRISNISETALGTKVYTLETENGNIVRTEDMLNIHYDLVLEPYKDASSDVLPEIQNEEFKIELISDGLSIAMQSEAHAIKYFTHVFELLVNTATSQVVKGNIETWNDLKDKFEKLNSWEAKDYVTLNCVHQIEVWTGALAILKDNATFAAEQIDSYKNAL